MTAILFTNNAITTINGGISSTATSIVLATGTGTLFPNPGSGQGFYAQLVNGTTTETVLVTERSTDTCTVVRAQDGSAPSAFPSGSAFTLIVGAAALNSLQTADGASYANETSGRALGTAYTNESGRTLYVAVTGAFTAAGTLSAAVAGTTILTGSVAASADGALFFAVPNGATYEVTNTGTATLSSWYEM